MGQSFDFEADILPRLQRGEHEAFTSVVTTLQEPLTRFVRSMFFFQDDHVIADIVQEAFIAFHRTPNVKSVSKIHSYIFRIASNKVIDHWRRERRHKSIKAKVSTEQAVAPDFATQSETKITVMQALTQLADKYKLPLLMVEYEKYSYQEIADILQLKLSTVKTRVFRAREQLMVILKRMGVGYE